MEGTTLRLHVRDVIGECAITLDEGNAIYERLYPDLLAGNAVTLDFAGVKYYMAPFFNAALGRLLADIPADRLNELLAVAHLAPVGDKVMRHVMENARRYYAASEEERAMLDSIMDRALDED